MQEIIYRNKCDNCDKRTDTPTDENPKGWGTMTFAGMALEVSGPDGEKSAGGKSKTVEYLVCGCPCAEDILSGFLEKLGRSFSKTIGNSSLK